MPGVGEYILQYSGGADRLFPGRRIPLLHENRHRSIGFGRLSFVERSTAQTRRQGGRTSWPRLMGKDGKPFKNSLIKCCARVLSGFASDRWNSSPCNPIRTRLAITRIVLISGSSPINLN